MNKTASSEVQFARAANKASRKVQLLRYSLQTAAGVAAALLLLFSNKFDSAQKANVDSFEEKMFHIIRAFHVAGRCTDCGECSRVCPQGIPLHLFNRKFIKDIDTFYGEYQAGEDSTSKGPLTNFTFEDVEPSIVAERG